MAENTKIEWADHTFNPWIGCTKVSPACDHCYAEAWDRRFAVSGHAMRWGAKAERTRTSASNWAQPLKWNKQAEHQGTRFRVFCASLADVFDNQVPDEWRADLFELIRITPHLDWLLLTKRPQNIVRMVSDHGAGVGHRTRFLPENVWLGTTAEDQKRANDNVIALLRAKKALGARVAFLSIEPMLSPIQLWKLTDGDYQEDPIGAEVYPLAGIYAVPDCDWPGPKIDWVIVGGESGPGARPMHPDWARSLRDQCARAGVPFLFKQWGEWIPASQSAVAREANGFAPIQAFDHLDGHRMHRVGKKAAGRLLDGVEHNGRPE